MITELNLSPTGQAVAILVLLGLLWLVLKHRPTRIALDEPTNEPVEESTAMELNPDYGRYVWLAGRYYN
ncbi:hypothetical protein [Streptococcus danieliae]|uniref:hypothetical protein n=1 Tax=Streptococcus danieliae TaxID=747656 RepID=UPI0026ECBC69|nr:hypothetical protein [Streptococcus danieliae]